MRLLLCNAYPEYDDGGRLRQVVQGVGEHRVRREDGSVDKARDPQLPDATLLKMYEGMRLIRVLDERCMNLQRQGRINFYIGSEGQEAVHVGAGARMGWSGSWIRPLHYGDAQEEYRAVRERADFLTMVGTPELDVLVDFVETLR